MSRKGNHQIRAAMATDIGKVRVNNEDAILLDPDNGVFIVSDGMGGHQAGEKASSIVVNVLPTLVSTMLERVADVTGQELMQGLKKIAIKLNEILRQESQNHVDFSGMGATVVMVLFTDCFAHIMNLGDSRAYLFRDRTLEVLTEDHTLAASLVRYREISPEEAEDHPGKNQLTRYVGMEGEAIPDLRSLPLESGDRILLCSDGLTSMVADAKLEELLLRHETPEDASKVLLVEAMEAGGKDNISIVVISVGLI